MRVRLQQGHRLVQDMPAPLMRLQQRPAVDMLVQPMQRQLRRVAVTVAELTRKRSEHVRERHVERQLLYPMPAPEMLTE